MPKSPCPLDADHVIEGDHLGRAPVCASEKPPVDAHPGAETLPRQQRHEVVVSDGRTHGMLRHGGERRIVLDPHERRPRAEELQEARVHPVPEVRAVRWRPAPSIHGSGHPDAHRRHLRVCAAGVGEHGVDHV
nr:hypothetical protein GCM10025699_33020 [Microbacterium flavescens]